VANPQVEKGHVRISNELFDAIINYKGLTGVDLKLIFFVIRKTYGWNRKKVQFSYGDVARGCNVDRAGVLKSIRRLVDQKVLFIQHTTGDRNSNIIGLNKNYDQWINNVSWEG